MKITTKRNQTHVTRHKQDNPIGFTVMKKGVVTSSKLLNDLSSLLPSKREEGFVSADMEDIVFLQAESSPESTEKLTDYHVFRGNKVLKDQVIIALVCEFLREDVGAYNYFMSMDWGDSVITRDKQDFLKELGSLIENPLPIGIDFMDYYTTSVKEFLEVKEDLKKVETSSQGFNINLAMFFKLLNKGLIVLKATDSGYISGEALLLQPYKSVEASLTNTCKSRRGGEKPLCIVEYFQQLINNPSVNTHNEILSTSRDCLERVDSEFYTRFGYNTLYALVVSRLK